MRSIAFIQSAFHDYYEEDHEIGDSLSSIDRREFGFVTFEGWMLRHKSFPSSGELRKFLGSSAPLNTYCSCAYYESPTADMEKKGWLGADLVFDIDSDHIPTPCDKSHDLWICNVCGIRGRGITPTECPVCNGVKFKVSTWPCEACLNSARKETSKLVDMLVLDFGFSKKDLRIFFSGHRGYHVHVESKRVSTLDAIARKEIVDYVSGLGLDTSFHDLNKTSLAETEPSQSSLSREFGWDRRLVAGIQSFLLNAEEEDIKEIGLKGRVAQTILQNRETIAKNWLSRRNSGALQGIGPGTWRKITDHAVKSQSAQIDTVVTTDVHRLIRLARTLHSKTGLMKVEFPVSALADFDPFKSAVALKTGSVIVSISEAPEFRLGDEVFGPYQKQRVELPKAAAALLVCKGRAEVIG